LSRANGGASASASAAPHRRGGARWKQRAPGTVTTFAASAEPEGKASSSSSSPKAEEPLPENRARPIGRGDDLIYVGKPKGEKEVNERTKFIKDDERLYPGREDVGPLLGAVGGFAGGEVGLKNYSAKGDIGIPDAEIRREILDTVGQTPEKEFTTRDAKPIGPALGKKRRDKIYVGKPKGAKDVDDRKKFIQDDERLYPGKEDAGFFIGASGGFAGGEVGLKRFAESGDIGIKEDGAAGRGQPQSPLAVAFGLGGIAAFGSIILDLPEETGGLPTINTEALQVPGLDPQIILSVAGGLGALAIGGYAYVQLKKATEKMIETTKTVAVTGVFLAAVAKLALTVLAS